MTHAEYMRGWRRSHPEYRKREIERGRRRRDDPAYRLLECQQDTLRRAHNQLEKHKRKAENLA